MRFSIGIADNHSENEWNDYVKSSPHSTVFHTWQWLKIMEKHTNSILYPLQIFKGSSHIANYPIFFKNKGSFRYALSPASNADSLYLGPVLQGYESFTQKKKEDYLVGIQSALDHFLFSELKCNFVRLRTAPGLPDSRPLLWAGYNVEPNYTYRLDLSSGLEEIWRQLHKTIRTNINSAQAKGIVIEKGNQSDLLFIESEIKRRFSAQEINKTDHSALLCDIFHEFNGHNLEIVVAKYEGKAVSGIIHLCYNGIVYQWVGVPKSKIAGLSPNELLVWESIRSAHKKGHSYYEFMDGGIDPRLRIFKSKFNPDTWIWYSAEKYSHPIYKMARTLSQKVGYTVRL